MSKTKNLLFCGYFPNVTYGRQHRYREIIICPRNCIIQCVPRKGFESADSVQG